MSNKFKKKVRVVATVHGFKVEVKRWFWPFWMQADYSYNQQEATARAAAISNPELAVVWTNEEK